jgi:ABC-type enterochelin transport system ATPase subunit
MLPRNTSEDSVDSIVQANGADKSSTALLSMLSRILFIYKESREKPFSAKEVSTNGPKSLKRTISRASNAAIRCTGI